MNEPRLDRVSSRKFHSSKYYPLLITKANETELFITCTRCNGMTHAGTLSSVDFRHEQLTIRMDLRLIRDFFDLFISNISSCACKKNFSKFRINSIN
jgi:hypothetical protein